VTMSGRVAATPVTASAGTLVDGSYLPGHFWQSNGSLPATITLDQGSSKHVAYLAVNQREDSITQTASSSRRIQGYTIQSSADGSTWSTVKSGTLPNARGAQYIDIGVTARFIRLVVNTMYSSSKTLRIDELWLSSSYAGGGTPTNLTVEAEASGNTLSGAAVVSSCTACSGGAKVRFIGSTASNFVTVNNINVSTAGTYTLTIQYGVNGTRTFDLSVNGGATIAVNCTGTDFNTPATTTVQVSLKAGNNSIRFFNNTAWAPDLDVVKVN